MGTKVLALGGAGGMGRFAARTASQLDAVESIVVADLSQGAAREFSRTLAGRAERIGLDVTDTTRLREAMLAADVVLNTTGPFFQLGKPILEMAIECQRHYLDICDDWEPTLDMLALDGAAREAGVTAIVGLGASPGLSNLLTLAAMNELDLVHEVYTGWDLGSAVPEEESAQEGVNAAMLHAIQQMTGTVKVWRDGDFAMERPLTRVPVDFPGVGQRTTHLFGHAEYVSPPLSRASFIPERRARPRRSGVGATRHALARRPGLDLDRTGSALLELAGAARPATQTGEFSRPRSPAPDLWPCGRRKGWSAGVGRRELARRRRGRHGLRDRRAHGMRARDVDRGGNHRSWGHGARVWSDRPLPIPATSREQRTRASRAWAFGRPGRFGLAGLPLLGPRCTQEAPRGTRRDPCAIESCGLNLRGSGSAAEASSGIGVGCDDAAPIVEGERPSQRSSQRRMRWRRMTASSWTSKAVRAYMIS